MLDLRVASVGLWALLILTGSLSADVLKVGMAGVGHSTIQDAISAAVDGDVIQIGAGSYDGFIVDGKSLLITGLEDQAQVEIVNGIVVRNLVVGQQVQLRGLHNPAPQGRRIGNEAALSALNCAGSLRIANCSFFGTDHANWGVTYPGVDLQDCQDVTLDQCWIEGTITDRIAPNGRGDGGHALLVRNSQVAVFSSSLIGASGAHFGNSGWTLAGGKGGDGGIRTGSGQIYLSKSTAIGGRGGDMPRGPWGIPGAGGIGLRSSGAGQFIYLDCQLEGGLSGIGPSLGPGAVALPEIGGQMVSGQARLMQVSPQLFEDSELLLVFQGNPGDVVSFVVSGDLEHTTGVNIGPSLVDDQQWIPAGTIPSTGVLAMVYPVPGQSALGHQTLHFQGRAQAQGLTYLTNAPWALALDRGLDDCTILESPLGRQFCAPNAINSTGLPARLAAFGSHCASNNRVRLVSSQMPQHQFGVMLNAAGVGFVPNPGGAMGNLCLGGGQGIGVHNALPDIRNSGGAGAFSLELDLTQLPNPSGSQAVSAGQTRHFQVWYRDGSESNFTNAISIAFR